MIYSEKIRALIVDDEELNRRDLFLALKSYPNWEVVAQSSSVAAARSVFNEVIIDVIFLDIRMPQESGLQFAEELSKRDSPPLIIFVTAHSQHAIDAFRLHALDFLLKPVADQHLQQAIERAQQMLDLRQQANLAQALRSYLDSEAQETLAQRAYWQQVCVRTIGRIETIQLTDVAWIEAQGNYMLLHLEGRNIMYRASMTQLEEHLDPAQFMRTHRSCIVAKKQIGSLHGMPDSAYKVRLHCGDEVSISERYLSSVKSWMQQQN